MIRIEVKDQKDSVTLVVEGRLAGVFVPELAQCWREQTTDRVRPVIVDLRSLLSIDRDGRRLLRAMYESGVTFRGAGISMQDELEAIRQSPDM
jgi:anti-anti-sigma regulatory factor